MKDERALKYKLRFVEGVLYYEWDPIGVNDTFQAIDEYDNYAHQIVSMSSKEGFTEEALSKYLLQVETEFMGLSGNKDKAQEIAKRILSALT